jgi:hypothetical protein
MKILGVPMVAPVFRHLATLPGALQWVWDAMARTWRTGRLQEEAWRIATRTPMAPITPIPRAALAALGVDAAGLREIRASRRFVQSRRPGVTCFRWVPHPHPRRPKGQPCDRAPALVAAADAGSLPPMIDLDTLPREVAELLRLATPIGEPGDEPVVPNLYRHFAHRQGFLALVVTLLRPRIDDGSIATSANAIVEAMEVAADDFAPGMTARRAPHPDIEDAFEQFSAAIPEMIVVGRLLSRALPAD